jgi:hypothetical protein
VNKYPTKKDNHEVRKTDHHEPEVIEPSYGKSPFFSFRYSYKEMCSFGGKTYIRSEERRFENGRFESEEFEGTMDQSVYLNAVREMQSFFLNQTAAFMKMLFSFFPFSTKDQDK